MAKTDIPVTFNGAVVGIAHVAEDGTATIEFDEHTTFEVDLMKGNTNLSMSIYNPTFRPAPGYDDCDPGLAECLIN